MNIYEESSASYFTYYNLDDPLSGLS